jgi:hypothetical protein
MICRVSPGADCPKEWALTPGSESFGEERPDVAGFQGPRADRDPCDTVFSSRLRSHEFGAQPDSFTKFSGTTTICTTGSPASVSRRRRAEPSVHSLSPMSCLRTSFVAASTATVLPSCTPTLITLRSARTTCTSVSMCRWFRRAVGFSRGFRKVSSGRRGSRELSTAEAGGANGRSGLLATPRPSPYGCSAGCTMRRGFPASGASATRRYDSSLRWAMPRHVPSGDPESGGCTLCQPVENRPRPGWCNGSHAGLKIQCPRGRAGSTPAPGTIP